MPLLMAGRVKGHAQRGGKGASVSLADGEHRHVGSFRVARTGAGAHGADCNVRMLGQQRLDQAGQARDVLEHRLGLLKPPLAGLDREQAALLPDDRPVPGQRGRGGVAAGVQPKYRVHQAFRARCTLPKMPLTNATDWGEA